MANLSEVISYDSGVYQIETTDPVLGGPTGVSNAPLKNLANRTAYLKKHVDDLESGATVPPGIATQDYVQTELAKLDWKASVRVATTANITLSGLLTIDGVTVATGDRVLVKNQTTGSQNGIYLANTGAWTRSTDADANAEVTPGMTVQVEDGSTQADSVWKLTTNAPISIGTTALTFVDFAAGFAPIASPAFTGTPTVPTAAADTSTTQAASTAFVLGQAASVAPVMNGTATVGTSSRYARQDHVHPTDTSRAPIASPAFSGTPTAPTAGAGTNTNQIATTAGVIAEIVNQFAGSGKAYFGSSGYQRLPSGLIIQWGTASIAANGGGSWTYPVAFPNAVLHGGATKVSALDSEVVVIYPGQTSMGFENWPGQAATPVMCIAIGY